ncbi:hypothetical protein EMCG_02006 [[Emmonsia] crescens]|uniref:Uncharacterized protein n=1 Tax=[Emmonsia] crescens TaxID=73230 RepID=A0A0G2J212_9EURO|nr:hypothetical protein EMCG_02006 [Emmonsia crescens UAMH 3008]
MANFPDPGLLYNGTWYAFRTNSTTNDDDTEFHVLVVMRIYASGDREGGFFGEWKYTGRDALPEADSQHLLYYSGEIDIWKRHHCIGVNASESTDPVGPYKPEGTYGDGNCSNAIPPLRSTRLLLQKMKSDGIRPDDEPVQILDRLKKEDGPLVEALNSGYATARETAGPYMRAKKPLLKSGDFGLGSPGGATVAKDGRKLVFHAVRRGGGYGLGLLSLRGRR